MKNEYDKFRDEHHICDGHGHWQKDEPSFLTDVSIKEPLEKFRYLKGLKNNTFEITDRLQRKKNSIGRHHSLMKARKSKFIKQNHENWVLSTHDKIDDINH